MNNEREFGADLFDLLDHVFIEPKSAYSNVIWDPV